MTNQNHKIVEVWIEKADHDLGSAKIIFEHMPEYYDTIAFHSQQAVEKYIKAALISFEIDFKKTHDLPYLLELLSRKVTVQNEAFQKSIILNNFSVEIRYPNRIIKLSNEELIEAITIADEFRSLILSFLL